MTAPHLRSEEEEEEEEEETFSRQRIEDGNRRKGSRKHRGLINAQHIPCNILCSCSSSSSVVVVVTVVQNRQASPLKFVWPQISVCRLTGHHPRGIDIRKRGSPGKAFWKVYLDKPI